MRKYELTLQDVNTLLSKNDCIDCCDGVLLDNFVLSFGTSTGFIFEEYVNPWTSKNVLYLVPNAHKNIINNLWERFNNLLMEV